MPELPGGDYIATGDGQRSYYLASVDYFRPVADAAGLSAAKTSLLMAIICYEITDIGFRCHGDRLGEPRLIVSRIYR